MKTLDAPVYKLLVPLVRRGDRDALAALASWLEDEWLIPRGLQDDKRLEAARAFVEPR